MICECVSSLLRIVIPVTFLAGNRDDSNGDDIKYEHSHLLCCLEARI